MTIPTMEDFNRLERDIKSELRELKNLLSDTMEKNSGKMVLSIPDVDEQYKISEYNQRKARHQGRLVYSKVGKEIFYKRVDVEAYVSSVTVK